MTSLGILDICFVCRLAHSLWAELQLANTATTCLPQPMMH